jgi:hypothetical protein
MTHRKGVPVLLAFVMLLAACGGTASSATHTAPAPALVKGEFVGDAGQLAGIGLSTNGRQVIAYLCNGTGQHVSVAQWFKGPVTSHGIDITNPHGAHLAATLNARAITGTVTLKNGSSAPFTARLIPDPGRGYGLFRSAETFRGAHYLGGWIIPLPQLDSDQPGTGAAASLTSVMVSMPTCCGHEIRGGILDEQTGALIVSPRFDGPSVTVPGLGTFRITPCREAQC